jgi:hypothetical protein
LFSQIASELKADSVEASLFRVIMVRKWFDVLLFLGSISLRRLFCAHRIWLFAQSILFLVTQTEERTIFGTLWQRTCPPPLLHQILAEGSQIPLS